MPLAFSYLRFSSPQQAQGDSIRRQTSMTETWCKRNGAQLDESLKFADHGRSGFSRKDFDSYALAEFVQHCKTGRVPKGSYLVVENLDRISRESPVVAVHRFTGILMAGVSIVQLSPNEETYTTEASMPKLMGAVMEFGRGNSESATKSNRAREAWIAKRREATKGRAMKGRVPGWVKVEGDKLILDPAGAKTVRRMFQLARDGYGVHLIAEKLNAEKVPTLGRASYRGRSIAWSTPTIYYILTSRATIGEHTPYRGKGADRQQAGDTIPDYYPPVIDADTFHAVRVMLKTRATNGRGRRGAHVNLFAGLLNDSRDGGSISYSHCQRRTPVLVPVGAMHGRGAKWVTFPAMPFEDSVLSKLREVKVSEVKGDDDAGRKVETLAGQLADLDIDLPVSGTQPPRAFQFRLMLADLKK